jgi:hypothetical protein
MARGGHPEVVVAVPADRAVDASSIWLALTEALVLARG